MKLSVKIFLFFIVFFLSVFGVWAQSRVPADSSAWLQGAYRPNDDWYGDYDKVTVIFFELDSSVTDSFYIGLNDPGTTTAEYDPAFSGDAQPFDAGDTWIQLYGGSGAYSSASRQLYFANPSTATDGTLLAEEVILEAAAGNAQYKSGWWYFPDPIAPSQGYDAGNKRIFKLVIVSGKNPYTDADTDINDNFVNLYQVAASSSSSGEPVEISGIRAFAYSLCVEMEGNTTTGSNWDFYPFVPEGAANTSFVTMQSYDGDFRRGNNRATPTYFSFQGWKWDGVDPVTPNETSNTNLEISGDKSNNAGEGYDALTDGTGDYIATWTDFGIEVTDNTTYASQTWHFNASGGAENNDDINGADIWFLLSTNNASTTATGVGYGAGEEPLRIYFDHYKPAADASIVLAYDDGVAKTDGGGNTNYEEISIQVVDINGNPVPYSRDLFLSVDSGAAVIDSITDDGGATGPDLGLTTTLVTTDNDGAATVLLERATITGPAEASTLRVYANGAGNTPGAETTDYGQGAGVWEDEVTVTFSDTAVPSISSAGNSSLEVSTNANNLPAITLTSGDAGSIPAGTLWLRIPSGTNAVFNATRTTPTLNPSAGAGAVNAAVAYSGSDKLAAITVSTGFDAGQTLQIGPGTPDLNSLAIDAGTVTGSFQLEMSWNGTDWVTDDKVISIIDTSQLLWTGANGPNWDDNLNWSPNTIPNLPAQTATITDQANDPLLTLAADRTINNLNLQTGATLVIDESAASTLFIQNLAVGNNASLTLNGTSMDITGDINNLGTITVASSDIAFAGTMNSDTGTVVYNPATPGGLSLGSSYYNLEQTGGAVTTAVPVTVNNDLTLTAGTLNLGNNLTVNGDLVIEAGFTLDLGTSNLTVAGSITDNGGNVTASTGAIVSTLNPYILDSDIDTNAPLVFNFPVQVTGGDRIIDTNTGNVTFNGTIVNAAAETNGIQIISTGTVTFLGDSGTTGDRLKHLTVSGGATSVLGGNIYTSGNTIEFFGPVYIYADITLSDSGTTGILFHSTLDDFGADATNSILTLETTNVTSSEIRFTGAVGSSGPLESLIINNSGAVNLQSTMEVDGSIFQSESIATTNDVNNISGNITTNINNVSFGSPTNVIGVSIVATGGGGITFSTPLELQENLTLNSSGGAVNLNTVNSDVSGNDTLTINAGAGIISLGIVGGTLPINSLVLNTSNTTLFTLPAITLAGTTPVLDVDTGGALSFGAAVNTGTTGTIYLNTGTGAITQGAELVANGLEIESAGTVTLNDNSNNVALLSASVDDVFQYRDSNALEVGNVNTITGITSTNDNITIETLTLGLTITNAVSSDTAAGNITLISATILPLAANLTAGTGSIYLTTGGDINQTGGSVTGTNLEISSGGFVNLGLANNVGTLASDSTGYMTFVDSNTLIIGDTGGFQGITTNDAVITVTTTAGNLSVSQSITSLNATGANIFLTAGGTLIHGAAITSGAGNTSLDGNGAGGIESNSSITTTGGNISINDPLTMTGNISYDSAGGNLSVLSTIETDTDGSHALVLDADTGALSVTGPVGATNKPNTAAFTSGTTAQWAVPALTVDATATLTVAGAGTAGIDLNGDITVAGPPGTVTISALNNAITRTGVVTINAAVINLTVSGTNAMGTSAAPLLTNGTTDLSITNGAGAAAYISHSGGNATITALNNTFVGIFSNGVTVSPAVNLANGDLYLEAQSIALSSSVTTGDQIVFNLTSASTLTTASSITCTDLLLLGIGSYSLSNVDADILASVGVDSVNLTDINDLLIGQITGDVTWDAGASDYNGMTQTGAIAVTTLGTGTLTLDSSFGAVSTSGTAVTDLINLTSAGLLTIGQGVSISGIGADGTIDLISTGGNIDINNTVVSINGDITVNSNSVINLGADITTTASGGTVNFLDNTTLDNSVSASAETAWSCTGTLTIGSGTDLDLNAQNLTATTLVNNGTLILDGSQTITIGGNTLTAITAYSGTGLTRYDGTSDTTGSSLRLGNSYTDLTFNGIGGTWVSGGNLTITGTLTINNGIFNATGGNMDITGNIDIATGGTLNSGNRNINLEGDWTTAAGAVYTCSGGTVTFDGTTSDQTLTSGGTDGDHDFNNITFSNGSYILQLAANTVINGNFSLTAGELNLGGNTLQVAGNWSNGGTDAIGSGTVDFINNLITSIISGTTIFDILSCSVEGKTLQFTAGTTQTVGGAFNITGDGQLVADDGDGISYITMESTSSGTPWNLSLTGGLGSVTGIDLSDCNIVDGGNNLQLAYSQNSGGNDDTATGNYCIFLGRNFIWTGLGSDGNWSTGANWNYGTAPNWSDNVQIVDPGAPNQQTAIVNTAWLNNQNSDEVQNLTITSGTLNILAGNLDVRGNLINGGTVNTGSRDLSVIGNFTNNGILRRNGGTSITLSTPSQMATSGTVQYDTAGGVIENYTAGADYYNLIINENGQSFTLGSDLQLTAGGTLTVTDGTLQSSTFNITTPTLAVGTAGTLEITGSGVLTVSLTSNIDGTLTNGTAASTLTGDVDNDGTINIYAGALNFSGALVNTNGSVILNSTGNLLVTGDFSDGTLTGSSSNNPTMEFRGNVTLGTLNQNSDLILFSGGNSQNFASTGQDLGNVQINKTAGTAVSLVTGNASQQLNTGTLTLSSGMLNLNGLTWLLGANITINAANAVLNTGSGTLDGTSGATDYNLILTNGTVNHQQDGTLQVNDFTVNGGTYNGAGGTGTGTLTVLGNVNISAGSLALAGKIVTAVNWTQATGTVNAGASDITLTGDLSITGTVFTHGTSSITMDGGDIITCDSSLFDVTIDNTCVFQDSMDINNALQITATGDLSSSAGLTHTIATNWINSGSFTAGSTTIRFDGTAGSQVNSGGDSFNNLTVTGNKVLQVITNAITVTGILRTDLAASEIDLQGFNATINTLQNNGTVRLDGTQTVSVTTPNSTVGVVAFSGAGGNISQAGWNSFYTVSIEGDAAGDIFTPAVDYEAYDVYVVTGTLQNGAATLTLHRRFDTSSATGSFDCGTGMVLWTDSIDGYIYGNNTFFNFVCSYDGVAGLGVPPDASVSGKNLYFQSGSVVTIDAAGEMALRGDNATPPPTIPLDGAYDPTTWITIRPTTDGTRWEFRKETGAVTDFRYLTVYWSDSAYNPVILPDFVYPYQCIDWYNVIEILSSYTEDSDSDGKIDRIQAQVAVDLVNNFSGFQVVVSGYTVTGYQLGVDVTAPPFPVDPDKSFYIYLAEQPVLDTAATPEWSIIENTTLVDDQTGSRYVDHGGGGTSETPVDTAPPVLGYTLSVADKDEVFIHFSEPVVRSDTSMVQTGDFTLSTGHTITSLSRPVFSGSGAREVLLSLDSDLLATDLLTGTVTVSGTLQDMVAVPNTIEAGRLNHRITDLGLGIVGNGLVEPVWARDETLTSETDGVGIINIFDGTDWLQPQNITLQSHTHNDAGNLVVQMAYDTSAYINNVFLSSAGLWVPNYDETIFSGITSYPFGIAPSRILGSVDSPTTQLRNFIIPAADDHIHSEVTLDFLFYLPAYDLYCGRVADDASAQWFRLVTPWSFDLHDIIDQKGRVTILNNIINPLTGGKVTVNYEVRSPGLVLIQVFDMAGGLVKILTRENQNIGEYSVTWDGRNNSGNVVARGIYFVRVSGSGKMDEMRKILVEK